MAASYATFGLSRSLRQARHLYLARHTLPLNKSALLAQIHVEEGRIAQALQRPVESLSILEIGPGQGRERAQYFGVRNDVTAIDLDWVSTKGGLNSYWRMYRANGAGRVVKSAGRQLMIGRLSQRTWEATVGQPRLTEPTMIHGDICDVVPGHEAFDVVMSWSVFEHLESPERALRNVIASLRPGGVLYLSIHLHTSNDGHHDIRSFTGAGNELPLWAHLRSTTRAFVQPSAYLNEWRLAQWRELFDRLAPGNSEYLDQYEHPERFGPQLNGSLREELANYSDEELLTVNAVYCWRKPRPSHVAI